MAPGHGLRGGLPAAWQAGRRFGDIHSAFSLHGVNLAHLAPVGQWPVGSIGLIGEKSSSIVRLRDLGAKLPGAGTRENGAVLRPAAFVCLGVPARRMADGSARRQVSSRSLAAGWSFG